MSTPPQATARYEAGVPRRPSRRRLLAAGVHAGVWALGGTAVLALALLMFGPDAPFTPTGTDLPATLPREADATPRTWLAEAWSSVDTLHREIGALRNTLGRLRAREVALLTSLAPAAPDRTAAAPPPTPDRAGIPAQDLLPESAAKPMPWVMQSPAPSPRAPAPRAAPAPAAVAESGTGSPHAAAGPSGAGPSGAGAVGGGGVGGGAAGGGTAGGGTAGPAGGGHGAAAAGGSAGSAGTAATGGGSASTGAA
ncbi:MAG TPA: hypothetical protein VMI52_10710, partial [Acetobacteraceae bacterium]|nr:hypothetical protein [Acetobacteraceae bacterium]